MLKHIMSTSLDIIKEIITGISKNDCVTVQNKLLLLPISLLSSEKSEELISTLLNFCCKFNNQEASKKIIEIFNEFRLGSDCVPALTNLFVNNFIDRDVLKFVLSCYPNRQTIDYYVDLINGGDDMLAIKAVATIDVVLPDLPYEDWVELLKLTKLDPDIDEDELLVPHMSLLNAFFESKVAEHAKPIDKPRWVKNFPVVELQDTPDYLPTVEDAVDLLLFEINKKIKLVSEEDNEDVDIKPGLISQYAISTIPEKLAMIQHLKKLPDFDDTDIFREYGPVNTIYTVTKEIRPPDHPCVRYGGCRMLTCTEFEFNDDDDYLAQDFDDSDEYMTYQYKIPGSDEIYTDTVRVSKLSTKTTNDIDWFKFRCEVCLIPIEKRENALRKPLNNGGWIGCFCEKCLKDSVDDPSEAIMVGRMFEQLERIGIRER